MLKIDLEAELTRVHQEFAAYKAKVREKALDAADSEGWCREGLNSALTDLGLERVTSDYDVRLTINLSRSITVRIAADDYDSAYETAEGYREMDLPGLGIALPDGWEFDDLTLDAVDEV